MDSGNSGSLQSSSGGDEEYDSRAAAHSLSFISTTHSSSHLRPISTAPPPLFDPLSTYLHLLHNPNPNPPVFHSTAAAPGETTNNLVAARSQNTAARNPRKRSRASRRAPTTVLTTDTTNFRAMVQEFTGIPAPPFDASSFSRNRLDPFTTRSTAFEPPFQQPPYLRRPFPQKAQSPPPFLASSTPITQSSNLFNVQNQNSFSSLLQSHPNPRFSKTNDQNSFGIPDYDRFGLRHHENHHVSTALINGLPNLVSPDQVSEEKDHQIKTSATTGGGGGYSLPPPVNMAARGGGMVESWVCSSE